MHRTSFPDKTQGMRSMKSSRRESSSSIGWRAASHIRNLMAVCKQRGQTAEEEEEEGDVRGGGGGGCEEEEEDEGDVRGGSIGITFASPPPEIHQ
eukprot:2761245-Rhodomonas_salina.2